MRRVLLLLETRETPTVRRRWGLGGERHNQGDPAKGTPRRSTHTTTLQVRFDLGGGVFPVLGMYAEEVPDEGQC